MKNFRTVNDINNLDQLLKHAFSFKDNPYAYQQLGKQKTIGLFFFNASLRTRLSTQKAAQNLGMQVMVMNFDKEGWQLEFEEGVVMNIDKAEHIKEAAAVISQYVDIIGIRAFPSLTNKVYDEAEKVLNSFVKYANVPIVNMESATAHPLQALTDALTIKEHIKKQRPKVVLSWAPHPKALPHAVANSFVRIMQLMEVDLYITHPQGYELNPKITQNTPIIYNQKEAFKNADIVFAKNWSSYKDYGKVVNVDHNWKITLEKLNTAKFMHCLPVRRNVVVADDVLDSNNSLVIKQANNRVYAAQAVLKEILESL